MNSCSEPASSAPPLGAINLDPESPPHANEFASCTIVDAINVLGKNSNEQYHSLKSLLNRLLFVAEKFGRQHQSTDRKTAFWTSYKTLADEFDKELQDRYGSDLDTSLIFAGLFSAVTSAFIIQIQPELQPDPNATAQTMLLVLLVQNVTGAPVPGIQVESSAVSMTVVVSQTLLYFSLFSTLLAALHAVLAKQWLQSYSAVRSRGTIAERGLERQQKFDGLLRWKFELVVQLSPHLLQLSLLLFSASLSLYLSTIHWTIAAVALSWTLFGCVMYLALALSALWWSDSPFQTPLTQLLMLLTLKRLWVAFMHLRPSVEKLRSSLKSIVTRLSHIHKPTANHSIRVPPPGTTFLSRCSKSSSSDEIPGMMWVLEISSDPVLVEAAANLVPEVQWPLGLDLALAQRRLYDIFLSCVDQHITPQRVRPGMDALATACMRALTVFRMLSEAHQDSYKHPKLRILSLAGADAELASLLESYFSIFHGPHHSVWLSAPIITRDPLRLLAAQRLPRKTLERVIFCFQPLAEDCNSKGPSMLLADFLFCLHIYFFPLAPAEDIVQTDKSQFCRELLESLFTNLTKSDSHMDHQILDAVFRKVACFKQFQLELRDMNLRHAVYRFCAIPDLPHTTRMEVLRLAYSHLVDPITLRKQTHNVSWIFDLFLNFPPIKPLRLQPNLNSGNWNDLPFSGLSAIEVAIFLGQSNLLACLNSLGEVEIGLHLLHILFQCNLEQTKPPITFIHSILWALSQRRELDITNPADRSRLQIYAFHILCSTPNWFFDTNFQQILLNNSVWERVVGLCIKEPKNFNLSAIAVHNFVPPNYFPLCISLASKLSGHDFWKPAISKILLSWLSLLPVVLSADGTTGKQMRGDFCLVLLRVWGVSPTPIYGDEVETVLAIAFRLLSTTWNSVNWTDPHHLTQIAPLIDCTASIAMHTRVTGKSRRCRKPTERFKTMEMARLGDAIRYAVEQARKEPIDNLAVQFQRIALVCIDFSAYLVSKIDELMSDWPQSVDWADQLYWGDIQEDLESRVAALHEQCRRDF